MKVQHYRSGKTGIIIEEIGKKWVKVRYCESGAVVRGLRSSYSAVPDTDTEMILREFESNPGIGRDYDDIASPRQLLELQDAGNSSPVYSGAVQDGSPLWIIPVTQPQPDFPSPEITEQDISVAARLTESIGALMKPDDVTVPAALLAMELSKKAMCIYLKLPPPLPSVNIPESVKKGKIEYCES
ncbi:MAG: hypothetical protein GY749_02240 [Desulfobacteraceae bacterium]|nr:hypothetical protein [Desulfobacteraceae bacterium]